MARDPDALASGATVGPLTVGDIVVRTPESIVYKARHGALGDVLLQEYWPRGVVGRAASGGVELANPAWQADFRTAVGRFQDRAEQLFDLPERSRPQVLELLGANGTAYVVMKAVEGQTLASALDAGRFRTSAELKQLDGMLADALGDWHWKGVSHGDLTPETLLVTGGDSPRLIPIGFGAAKDLQLKLTRSPEAVSTPGYTAFEQYDLRGEEPPGPAADLYAAGAILYRAVTGAPPQEPDRRLVRSRHKTLSDLAPAGLDGAFKLRVDKALEPLSENRPQTVYDWRALSAEPPPPPEPVEPTPEPPRPGEPGWSASSASRKTVEVKTKRPAKPSPVLITPAVIPPPPTFAAEDELESEPEQAALFDTPPAEKPPEPETDPPAEPEPATGAWPEGPASAWPGPDSKAEPEPEPEPAAAAPPPEPPPPEPPKADPIPPRPDPLARPVRKPSKFPWAAVIVVAVLGAAVAAGAVGLRYWVPQSTLDKLKSGVPEEKKDDGVVITDDQPPPIEDQTAGGGDESGTGDTGGGDTAGGGPPPLGDDGTGSGQGAIALVPSGDDEPVWEPVPENDREAGGTTIRRSEEPKSKAKAEPPPAPKPKVQKAKVCRQVCTEGDRIPVYAESGGGGTFGLSLNNFSYPLNQSGSVRGLAERRGQSECQRQGGSLAGVTVGRADCDPVGGKCFVSLSINCRRAGGSRSIIRYDRGPQVCRQVCQ